jgi:hypothetical protein
VPRRRDIQIFFEKRFTEIREDFHLPAKWPGPVAIAKLTQSAAGLFVWATTAMMFIEGECAQRNHRSALNAILEGKLGEGTKTIDELYRQILDLRFKDSGESTLQLFKMVLGTIIVAKTPLRLEDLQHFLGRRDDDEIVFILGRLSSVISKAGGTLRLHHPSFLEFLCDPERCNDPRFTIDPNEQHGVLALTCLQLMKKGLKFNICNLDNSYLRNDDVEDLESRIKKSIPIRLKYSCRFWAEHIRDSTTATTQNEILVEVRDFFHICLLYWLEVLSLIKEVSIASNALVTSARWISVRFLRPISTCCSQNSYIFVLAF